MKWNTTLGGHSINSVRSSHIGIEKMVLTVYPQGLLTLAVKHYERVLTQVERRLDSDPEVSFTARTRIFG